jgi:hypothetical protein
MFFMRRVLKSPFTRTLRYQRSGNVVPEPDSAEGG